MVTDHNPCTTVETSPYEKHFSGTNNGILNKAQTIRV